MALFPIVGRFAGDFVAHLVAVDTDDTMDAVAAKVAVHSVGRRLPQPAGDIAYQVRIDGQAIDPGARLGDLGLMPLQWLDVAFRD